MTKKEMREKWYNRELKAVAHMSVTIHDYLEIYEIEHGINDYVCGLYNRLYADSQFFRRKIYYENDNAYFMLGTTKLYLSDAIRTNIA